MLLKPVSFDTKYQQNSFQSHILKNSDLCSTKACQLLTITTTTTECPAVSSVSQ